MDETGKSICRQLVWCDDPFSEIVYIVLDDGGKCRRTRESWIRGSRLLDSEIRSGDFSRQQYGYSGYISHVYTDEAADSVEQAATGVKRC